MICKHFEFDFESECECERGQLTFRQSAAFNIVFVVIVNIKFYFGRSFFCKVCLYLCTNVFIRWRFMCTINKFAFYKQLLSCCCWRHLIIPDCLLLPVVFWSFSPSVDCVYLSPGVTYYLTDRFKWIFIGINF